MDLHQSPQTGPDQNAKRTLTAADVARITELATAVLIEDLDLVHTNLSILVSTKRKPQTRRVLGVHFGHHGVEGYLVAEPDASEPLIAIDADRPRAHRGHQHLMTVSRYMVEITNGVNPRNIASVVDKLAWQIERLLQDGHPLKRTEHPDDRI